MPALILFSLALLSGPAEVPEAARLVPAVVELIEPELLLAGKPQSRVARARMLASGLKPLGAFEPLREPEVALYWVAVLAMLESALQAGPKEPAWIENFLDTCRAFQVAEPGFERLGAVARVRSLQEPDGPLERLASQLQKIPAHCRAEIRRTAGAPKDALPGAGPAMIAVARRESDFGALLAWSMGDKPEMLANRAEALFELDRPVEAQALAARLPAGPFAARAALRAKLAEARAAARSKPARFVEVARLLEDLGEGARLKAVLPPDRALALASAELDERYVRSLLGGSFDFPAAWDYARRARARTPTPAFLGIRIGAGLAVALSEGVGSNPAADVLRLVRADFPTFRPVDPRRTDQTALTLEIFRALAGEDIYALAKQLAPAVARLQEAYPVDPAAIHLAYLIGALNPAVPMSFRAIEQAYAAAGPESRAALVPLVGGAALTEALGSSSPAAPLEAAAWLSAHDDGASPDIAFWRAELLAAAGFLLTGPDQQNNLQAAIGEFSAALARVQDRPPDNPEMPCLALASLATLLLQSQQVEDAKKLLDQVDCSGLPESAGVMAIVDLAHGEAPYAVSPIKRLEQAADRMRSRLAQVQAWLWLGLTAEASGQAESGRAFLQKAARQLALERERGRPVPLAPDLRSILALGQSFGLQANYDPESPFRLRLEISVNPVATLFPPAAVSAADLASRTK